MAPGIEAISPLDVTGDDQCPDGEGHQWEGLGGPYNDSNEISAFFDVLKSCAHVLEYFGRIAINKKWLAMGLG
uniref:Uncharacterized protein n=1 Tax=Amphimedon queenslandica TaxID=400682 RepID=A0A1X7SRI1_AMPQE